MSPREVKLETTSQGLTSYAGLLPVVRFLQKSVGFRELCSETVAHERGANATYQLADVVELTVLGLLGGAVSLTPWETHKAYGKRATCEAWIEEAKKRKAFQKNQRGLAALRTEDFQANAALFQCAVLAHNLIRWRTLLSGDEPFGCSPLRVRMPARL